MLFGTKQFRLLFSWNSIFTFTTSGGWIYYMCVFQHKYSLRTELSATTKMSAKQVTQPIANVRLYNHLFFADVNSHPTVSTNSLS